MKLFNVTEAISLDSNHGITRTERMIASQLLGNEEVGFFAYIDHAFRVVEHETLKPFLQGLESEDFAPNVEYFGTGYHPAVASTQRVRSNNKVAMLLDRGQMRSRMQRARHEISGSALTKTIEKSTSAAVRCARGDVLLSVGLDWTYDYLGFAERQRFAHGARVVGFCYDLIPIVHPQWLFPPDPTRFVHHFRRLDRVSDRVLCISRQTKTDYEEFFSTTADPRVRVITLGGDLDSSAELKHRKFADSLFDGEDFVLYVATIDRRKNHELLYRATKILQSQNRKANILFVGKVGSGVNDLMQCLRTDRSLEGTIGHVTNCDDRYLAAIYRRCSFAVYPSLYEGWGLGVTEALAHGKHCIIADDSSLPEAGLGVCQMLNPWDSAAWAAAIDEHGRTHLDPPMVSIPSWRDTAQSLLTEMDF
jgi:glycosyltransferase involved in cell wall biosynthesis